MTSSELAESASPYLRAHAGNPVAWRAWGPDAFAEARRRDVPVLVSIGYSTCHWCHVMARESFSDEDVAAVVNDGFVAIKVDREEHPDVDAAYLQAASAFTPHLGWPLTAFATPDGRVFYAGTYFPPEQRGGLPSFRQVLGAVTEAWTGRRAEVATTAEAVAEAIQRADAVPAAQALPTTAALADALRLLAAQEDPVSGGFANADADPSTPKFPTVPALRLLHSRAARSLVPGVEGVATRALAAMRGSALFDDVDGGFFRYATRRDWSEPHYERMLTDNAGLLEVALDAGDDDTARRVAGFLRDVLQQPSGGFAAAQDSESWIDGRRSEGGYYLRAAALRSTLEPPAIDAKIVTGWNGMAIGALAAAGLRLDDDDLVAAARWAADAVLENHLAADGTLVRASLDEIPSRAAAALEDYGLLAVGLLSLAVAAAEPRYADAARALVDAALAADGTPGGGDPVLRAQGVTPPVLATDGDRPSGAAALADASLRLWLLGAGEAYREAAERLVRQAATVALAQPRAYGAVLAVAAGLAVPPRQLIVVGDVRSPVAAAARRASADLLAIVSETAARAFAEAGYEVFADRDARDAPAAAYDCRAFVCRLPVTDPVDLER